MQKALTEKNSAPIAEKMANIEKINQTIKEVKDKINTEKEKVGMITNDNIFLTYKIEKKKAKNEDLNKALEENAPRHDEFAKTSLDLEAQAKETAIKV